MNGQRTSVFVYLALVWTIGFALIFTTTERRSDDTQAWSEAQKQTVLETASTLMYRDSEFKRQQESLSAKSYQRRANLEEIIAEKVSTSITTDDNYSQRGSEIVTKTLSNAAPQLSKLEAEVTALIDETIARLSLTEPEVLSLISDKGADAIRGAVKKAAANNAQRIKHNLEEIMKELIVPDPVVITPEVLSLVLSEFIQREVSNPKHAQIKAVQRWKAQLGASIAERVKNFDWKDIPSMLTHAESALSELIETVAVPGTVRRIVSDTVESADLSDLESDLQAIEKMQEFQTTDSQSIESEYTDHEQTSNKLEEKQNLWESSLSELAKNVQEVVALRERIALRNAINGFSSEAVNQLFDQLAESNDRAIKGIADTVLDQFSADGGVGMVDYASQTVGGKIYSAGSDRPLTRETLADLYDDPSLVPVQSTLDRTLSVINNLVNKIPPDFDKHLLSLVTTVRQVITPSVNPGDCWPFPGDKGNVTISLARPIVITHVTLEHAPGSTSIKPRHTSPKEFQVFGLHSTPNGGFTDPVLLYTGTFELDPKDDSSRPSIRTFPTQSTEQTFTHVRLRVLSNYGATYTCIYRFRVHSVV